MIGYTKFLLPHPARTTVIRTKGEILKEAGSEIVYGEKSRSSRIQMRDANYVLQNALCEAARFLHSDPFFSDPTPSTPSRMQRHVPGVSRKTCEPFPRSTAVTRR